MTTKKLLFSALLAGTALAFGAGAMANDYSTQSGTSGNANSDIISNSPNTSSSTNGDTSTSGSMASGSATSDTTTDTSAANTNTPDQGSVEAGQSAQNGMQGNTGMSDGTNAQLGASGEAQVGDTSVSANTNAGADVDSTQVSQAQQSLKANGYRVSVDGVWGPQTANAVRKFQQDNNLNATGTLTAETISALNSDNATGAGGTQRDTNSY